MFRIAPLAMLVSLVACVRSSSTSTIAEPSTDDSSAEAPIAQTVVEPKPQRELAPVAAKQVSPLEPLSRFAGEAIASETRDGGLAVIDYAPGQGLAAELGDFVEVHYILTLDDGREVDNSHAREEGFVLVLGETAVLPGFTAGLVGTKPGMLRKIIVPPALGYGERELAGIPANSTLIFHVQVMAVSDYE